VPYTSSQDIIRNYWRQGVLYPAYADPEGTMLNYNGLDMEQNTVAMMTADVSGYKKYKQKYFQSSATLTADFGEYTPVLKGLTAKAMFSYDYRADNNEVSVKSTTNMLMTSRPAPTIKRSIMKVHPATCAANSMTSRRCWDNSR
jgi:hypothetical protein